MTQTEIQRTEVIEVVLILIVKMNVDYEVGSWKFEHTGYILEGLSNVSNVEGVTLSDHLEYFDNLTAQF